MIIHIKKRENPYVQIDKRPLNDKRLSWKARGILSYLLSKPPDWRVMVKDLMNRSEKDGETAVRSALKELIDAGYMHRKQTKQEDGTFDKVEYVVYEEPLCGFPHADNPLAGNPLADNHKHTNNEYTKGEGGEKENEGNSNFELSSSSFSPEKPGEVSPETEWDEPRSDLLEMTIEKLSRTFGDFHHLQSNIQQAYNLWDNTSLGEDDFVSTVEEAAAITKEAISKSQVRERNKRMAYFFKVLRDKLGA